jgi:hypothetical protein
MDANFAGQCENVKNFSKDGIFASDRPGPPLLVDADFKNFISIHKPPASIRFAPIKHALAVTVEPFKFSPA